jgi:hypothetical protein
LGEGVSAQLGLLPIFLEEVDVTKAVDKPAMLFFM